MLLPWLKHLEGLNSLKFTVTGKYRHWPGVRIKEKSLGHKKVKSRLGK